MSVLRLQFEGEASAALLLEVVPRVVLDGAGAWLDVRGLDVNAVHRRVVRALGREKIEVRAGASVRPVVAQVAAATSSPGKLCAVRPGEERAFMAPHGLAVLGVPEPLLGWLADVGVGTCGELAGLAREALEVRFGADVVQWWRWSRGDDERRMFVPMPPELPSGSVEFVDYVVTDPERLLFTANALLGSVCDQMRERGMHARAITLRLPLANGALWQRTLRAARPTADRAAWLRLARGVLERITVPDSVTGVAVEVEATTAAAASQGDLFDAGFATASAMEVAVARLIEDQGDVLSAPDVSAHPLADERNVYRALSVREVMTTTSSHDTVSSSAGATAGMTPVGLTLQLLDAPRRVQVQCERRRDHHVPVRYRDRKWQRLVDVAGPDRVSGGQWDETYAREYFRAVSEDGTLVWLYHDAVQDAWFLHGWWD